MRILFAATDYIAIPLLEALSREGLVGAVLTAPDAPGKRGKSLIPSPIKVKALELGLEVYSPETLRTEAREYVKTLSCDTLLSFCYGKIFGPMFLTLFERTFNVHPSALPKYRGCAPIYAAIKNGDRESAISLQSIALKVDEGDIHAVLPFELDGKENNDTLTERVGILAPELVIPALKNIDNIVPKTQNNDDASYQMFITKEDGKIDFSRSAKEIHAQIRACYPWPKAYALLGEDKLILTSVSASLFDEFEKSAGEEPGTVVALDKKRGLKIACADFYIYVDRVLPPMKKEMDAASYVNGNRSIIGTVLK